MYGTSQLIFDVGNKVDFLIDKSENIESLRDRKIDYLGYVMAARNDELNFQRSGLTHRHLAEVFFRSIVKNTKTDLDEVNNLSSKQVDLIIQSKQIIFANLSVSESSPFESFFRAVGFNLAQEFSASIEYEVLDSFFDKNLPELKNILINDTFKLKEFEVNGYTWINIHLSLEAEHAQEAVLLTDNLLKIVADKETASKEIKIGIDNFNELTKKMFSL
jgi:hypothetical protein